MAVSHGLRNGFVFLLLCALWVAVMAPPPPADQLTAPQSEFAGAADQQVWGACPQAPAPYECATVLVPRDYSTPRADSMGIAVIRRPATEPETKVGTLFINPGGPGNSGLIFLPAAVPLLFNELAEHFDLVSFDPRGVGLSDPVRCLDDTEREAQQARAEAFPDPRNIPQIVQDAARLSAACVRRNGTDLRYLSTMNVARDMDRVRAALGVAEISYLGLSYGTYLGATYSSLFPDSLRAMALDGALDPVLTALAPLQKDIEQARGFQLGLERFFTYCDSTLNECSFGGAAAAKFDELLRRVQHEPIEAPTGDATRPVTSHTVVTAVQAALYARQSWPFLGSALQQAWDAGDGSLLQLASDQFLGRDPDGGFGQWPDAFTAITAADRNYPRSVGRFVQAADVASRLAPTFGRLNVYASLPAGMWAVEPNADFEGPFTFRGDSVPALVVGTTFDTATPYRGAQAMVTELGNAVLLTMDGDGHTAYGRGSPCVDRAVNEYLVHLKLPPDDTRCQQQLTSRPTIRKASRFFELLLIGR